MSDTEFMVGIDLGGTKIESILLSKNQRELFRDRRPTEARQGYEKILQNIYESVRSVLEHLPANARFTVGIGIPGIIDPRTNLVRNANTTVLIGKPLKRDLEKLFGRSVVVENDANCFALAECRAGATRDFSFVFGIIMGTGCGGGLCMDGEARRGLHGICGEWGHISIEPDGVDCYCGRRGCIETLISGSGLEAAYERQSGKRLRVPEIVDLWRKREEPATEVMLRFLDHFGRALSLIVNSMDPDAIVLGGGLSNIPELYTDGVEAARKWVFYDPWQTPVLRNQLGDSAGVIGAAWLGTRALSKDSR